jgi:hypothetical protein
MSDSVNVASVLLVLTVLGLLWPLRRIVWFPLAVVIIAVLAIYG